MNFTSSIFIFFFFPISMISYFLIARINHGKYLNIHLILFSLLFLWWGNVSIPFIFLFSGLVYMLGSLIGYSRNSTGGGEHNTSAKWFLVSIIASLLCLIYFKYWYFILGQLNNNLKCKFEIKNVVAPLGISFLTFSAISYLVDIYRNLVKAGSFTDAFFYFIFFPKFISGPIFLWRNFSSYLSNREISVQNISKGIERIIIGLAKKVIFADTFGECIQQINTFYPDELTLLTVLGRSVLYMFQIYLDFSGYSDISIGLMKVFGFETQENFDYPYTSESLSDFWRKWHISLGSFFREYVYIPLGGNRRGNVYFNLFVVFALTGIWHGTGLNFFIWGALNGIIVCFERYIKEFRFYKAIPRLVKIFITLFIVYLLWVIFMNKDFVSTIKNFRRMTQYAQNPVNFSFRYFFDTRIIVLLFIAGVGSILSLIPYVKEKCCSFFETTAGTVVKYVFLIFLFIVSISFIVNSTYHPFIYFQF